MWVEEILWKRKFNLQYVCGWEDRKLSENWKSFRGDTARNYFVCLHLCIHLWFVCCSWESNILFIDDMEPPDIAVTLKYLTDKVSKVQCEPSLLLILYPGRSPGAVVHYSITFIVFVIRINFPGWWIDSNRGLVDSLHRLRVRSSGWVHGHPAQDEDEEADGDQEEEGQLRHHWPRLLCLLPHSLYHLQHSLLELDHLEQARSLQTREREQLI